MSHFHGNLALLISVQLIVFLSHTEAKVPAVIVFGDSSVDAGNNGYIPTIGRSNFAPYGRDFDGGKATGRFCNGRLSTDFISEAFGLKSAIPAYLDPAYTIEDFATGVTFASAGTGLDNLTAKLVNVLSIWKELEYFKEYNKRLVQFMGDEKAATIVCESVYIISIGTNDFLENYYTLPVRMLQFTVDEYMNYLLDIKEKFVMDIYKLGARKIVLTGFTAFGCLPLERTTNFMHGHACNEEYNKVARDFNVKLNALINKLTKKARGIRLAYSEVYNSLDTAVRKPYLYGFENVDKGCCGTGKIETAILCNKYTPTCKDANKYIFWDSIHYTEKMNRFISDHAMVTAFAQYL